MPTYLPNLVLQGATGAFYNSLEAAPQVWQNHVMTVPSGAGKETYAFPGAMPVPRVLTNARSIQGFRDMKFDVENQTHELTIVVKLEDFEDDQVAGITRRFQELGEVFGTYKDQVFANLLIDNNPPPMADDPAVTWANFYTASLGTIGSSATFDNTGVGVTATGLPGATTPTTQEFLNAIANAKAAFLSSGSTGLGRDDQGRAGFNSLAATKLGVIIPPIYEHAARTAQNSAVVPDDTDGATSNNVWANTFTVDVLPYLTSEAIMYTNALGATRKPFIYQQRTPLEIVIDTDRARIQQRNGVMVTVRERWVMTYGDPRRSYRETFS
jgi:phage major head subunit gpT-like protein